MMRIRRGVVAAAWLVFVASSVEAQPVGAGTAPDSGTASSTPAWSLRASATVYMPPDEENYVQPTVAADRGALHLEGRYNYEDRNSVSGFAGWNFEFGETVTVQLTPMFGGVVGDTDAVIPALEGGVAWKFLEFYLEGEYVIDVESRENRFLYNWSEASVWFTEWIRAGLVTQRTRAYQTPRDTQRGPLVGVSLSKVEGAVYYFNPGSDHSFFAVSIGVTF